MADRLFILARRMLAAHKHEAHDGCAMKLVHDAGQMSESPYRIRALGASKLNKKQRGIRRLVRTGDCGYSWPTRFSENMADVCPRRFSVA